MVPLPPFRFSFIHLFEGSSLVLDREIIRFRQDLGRVFRNVYLYISIEFSKFFFFFLSFIQL